jgi:hypothetical protein
MRFDREPSYPHPSWAKHGRGGAQRYLSPAGFVQVLGNLSGLARSRRANDDYSLILLHQVQNVRACR